MTISYDLIHTIIHTIFRSYSWRNAFAVGVTMAHVGEFAFVLLSASSQLNILPQQVYSLLIGITALSLLTTPLVVLASSRLLKGGPSAALSPLPGRMPLMAALENDD